MAKKIVGTPESSSFRQDYASLIQQYQGKIEQLSQCLKITALINSELNYSRLLTNIMQTAQVAVSAEACSLLLYDEKKEYLTFQVAESEKAGDTLRGGELKSGVGIAGTVAESGRSMLVADAYQCPLFNSAYDKKTGFKTKSVLAVPLKFRDEVIGVTMVINKKDGSIFTEDDTFILESISHSASVAIENARLHDKELYQQKIIKDLEFAQSIQRSFMPEDTLDIDALSIDALNIPALEISGDFYDYFPLEGESGEVAFIIGDVSGKGVAAALYGARLISDFRFLASTNNEPALFCEKMNGLLLKRTHQGMFATVIYGITNPRTGHVRFANAGHIPPLLYRSLLGGVKIIDQVSSVPLGIVDGVQYETSELTMNNGDYLLFLTDGIIEQRNKAGDELGLEYLIEIIQKEKRPQKLLSHLMNEVSRFGQKAQHDDMTLLSLHRCAHSAKEPPPCAEASFNSCPSKLKEIREHVNAFLEEQKMPESLIGALILCIDEACSNVIKYSYNHKDDEKIVVRQFLCGDEYIVAITDYGKKPDVDSIKPRCLEDVKPGGLGTHFMQEVMDSIEYDCSCKASTTLIMKKIWRENGS